MMRNFYGRHQGRFVVIASCIYAALTLFRVLHHAPWRDEADPWLAARDMSLAQLWPWMHYVGTPALWYLILMPFAKLGFPYLTLNIVHWLIAVTSAVLMLSLAPFPKLIRVTLVFSFYMTSEYVVIARNYAPLILLLILIAWLYPKRFERPITLAILLTLLANTAVHGTIFAAAFLGAWGLNALHRRALSRRVIFAGFLAAAGVLGAVAEVLPAPADGQLSGALVARNAAAVDFVFSHVFTPVYPDTNGAVMTRLHRHLPVFIAAWIGPRVLGAILFAWTLWLLRRNPPILFAFCFAFLALLYVFVFKHIGGDRHTGLVWALSWITLWILLTDTTGAESIRKDLIIWKWGLIPFTLASLYSIGMALYIFQLQIRTPFSGSKAAATFLVEHHLADRPIAMFQDNHCEPILPYLGRKSVWYAGQDCYGTYMNWNRKLEESENGPPDAAMARIVEKSALDPSLVIVLNTDLPAGDADLFELLFDNRNVPAIMPDERYAIYVRRH
jgi:hypothetical protein